jgi:glycosyltransferase involved in cell wall biosynthesis
VAARDAGYDVLHLETTWCGWLSDRFDAAKSVLNVHSLYCIDDGDGVPPIWPARLESSLRLRAERRILRSHPNVITLTPRLERAVQEIAPAARTHVVPLALDLALYPFIPDDRRTPGAVVGVVGSMNWGPSLLAAVRLLTRLWPEIRRAFPAARLQVVGWNARTALRAYLSEPGVSVVEDVADARPYFEQTSIFLYAPPRGTGMKVKVLEAFAYGVPVVTTPVGVEGLPARDGVHAGISDDDAGLVRRALSLLGDRDRQDRQRAAARAMVEATCGPEAGLSAVERCYAGLARPPLGVSR